MQTDISCLIDLQVFPSPLSVYRTSRQTSASRIVQTVSGFTSSVKRFKSGVLQQTPVPRCSQILHSFSLSRVLVADRHQTRVAMNTWPSQMIIMQTTHQSRWMANVSKVCVGYLSSIMTTTTVYDDDESDDDNDDDGGDDDDDRCRCELTEFYMKDCKRTKS